MGKQATIKWAKANNVRFVFSQRDGLGYKVYFATNDDRRNESHLTLEWAA